MKGSPRRLFVEGGGDHNRWLQTECRRAFSMLLTNAGFGRRMPRIVVCGGRANAYDQFCTALAHSAPGEVALLLVDAEAPVDADSPWVFVKQRKGDGWCMPAGAEDKHLHLMVQSMEAWIIADRAALGTFFDPGFRAAALPAATANLEQVSKCDLERTLQAATKAAKTKGAYNKGRHSFKLLAQVDPKLVRASSPWAERFFATLDALLV